MYYSEWKFSQYRSDKTMKTVDTYYANIYMGMVEGYTGKYNLTYDDVSHIIEEYCDKVKLGVTFTRTKFIYVDGNEDGFIIGIINYPRFPSDREMIKHHAEKLGKILMKELKQERFSIVYPDETVMFEKEDI